MVTGCNRCMVHHLHLHYHHHLYLQLHNVLPGFVCIRPPSVYSFCGAKTKPSWRRASLQCWSPVTADVAQSFHVSSHFPFLISFLFQYGSSNNNLSVFLSPPLSSFPLWFIHYSDWWLNMQSVVKVDTCRTPVEVGFWLWSVFSLCVYKEKTPFTLPSSTWLTWYQVFIILNAPVLYLFSALWRSSLMWSCDDDYLLIV